MLKGLELTRKEIVMTVSEYPAVTDDQYVRVDARMLDIKRRLTQKSGPPFDVEELIDFLQKAAEGEFGLTKGPADEVIRELERWDNAGKRFWKKLLSDLQLRRDVADLVNSRLPGNPTQLAHVQQRRIELWTCTHLNKSHQKLKSVST